MAQIIDTNELDTTSTAETVLPTRGRIKREKVDSDLISEVEVVSAYAMNDKAARLAFMEEVLDVMVHESADPNAEDPVHVAVNGVNQFFRRGQVQSVKRKYVGVLAQSKQSNINTREVLDRDGNKTTAIGKHTALKYPFSVVRDENPKGASWLKQVLAS